MTQICTGAFFLQFSFANRGLLVPTRSIEGSGESMLIYKSYRAGGICLPSRTSFQRCITSGAVLKDSFTYPQGSTGDAIRYSRWDLYI